jgi:hypothetical protein
MRLFRTFSGRPVVFRPARSICQPVPFEELRARSGHLRLSGFDYPRTGFSLLKWVDELRDPVSYLVSMKLKSGSSGSDSSDILYWSGSYRMAPDSGFPISTSFPLISLHFLALFRAPELTYDHRQLRHRETRLNFSSGARSQTSFQCPVAL